MRRKFSLLTVLFAWLLATGSHWDLVQSFAWARMIVSYSQTMSLAQAVKTTFTADTLCGMCEGVRDVKQQQQDADAPSDGKSLGKMLMVFQPQPVLVAAAPKIETWTRRDDVFAWRHRSPPPVPPPKMLM